MTTFGSVVLAAFEPDRDLFTRQLRSIRDQSHSDFECVIGADGNADAIRLLVASAVGDDGRFRVVGFEERVGFYSNFERSLRAIDGRSSWVALADQDDFWYPDKLAVLLPFLSEYALVTGQARLVKHPSGEVISASTRRYNSEPRDIVINNQFTGSFTVMRAEVLAMAHPFPRVRSRAQVHDHWLAVCASALDGAFVADIVLQDYVQHEHNVLGEKALHAEHFRPLGLLRRFLEECRRYEGSVGFRSLLRYRYRQVLGWDRAMAVMLSRRLPRNPVSRDLMTIYGPRRNVRVTIGFLMRSVRSGRISAGTALMFLQGWLVEGLASRAEPGREPDDADR
jgi:glycosyltransferase involved in cell wall biosynthesis